MDTQGDFDANVWGFCCFLPSNSSPRCGVCVVLSELGKHTPVVYKLNISAPSGHKNGKQGEKKNTVKSLQPFALLLLHNAILKTTLYRTNGNLAVQVSCPSSRPTRHSSLKCTQPQYACVGTLASDLLEENTVLAALLPNHAAVV